MDTQSHSNQSTGHSTQDALPVAEPVTATSAIEPIRPITPAASQQNTSTNLDKHYGNSTENETKSPLLVRVVEDDELSKFETKTVRFGKWTLIVAAFSLFAACSAAWFVYQQFVEMASQTELLSRSAKQARIDAKESSVSTARQLAILQGQLNQQQRSIQLDQRPWVKFEIGTTPAAGESTQTYSIPPLVIGKPLTIPVRFTNIGQTTAEDLRGGLFIQIVLDGKEPIIPRRRMIPDIPGERETEPGKPIPGESFLLPTLYPKDSTVHPFSRVKLDGSDDPVTVDEFTAIRSGKANIYLVGQVWYFDVFGVRHWTKYCSSTITKKMRSSEIPGSALKCAQFGGVDNNQVGQRLSRRTP